MNLRVVHIIGGGEFGGAEEHIIHLLKQLKHENIACEVICFYDSLFAKMLRELQIPVLVLNYGRFDIRLLFGLASTLREINPDIIHSHGVKANFFTRMAVRKLANPILITTVHSLLKYDYSHPIVYRLALLIEMITRPKTDYFIAVSHKIKQQLITEHVNEAKIQVIHHGIDTNNFSPKEDFHAEELAKQWGKEENVFLIGTVGRIQPIKGFAYFIKACAELHRKKPGAFRFIIVGEGPERENLEEMVSRNQLGDVFHFAGFRRDVATVLRAFDGYVNSSLSEGLGLSVIEALASGTPVVTTNVDGIKDFARHEKNCLIVEPKNSEQIVEGVLRLHGDKELAATLSEQGTNDMRASFSQERMGKETAFFYRQCLKEDSLGEG